jgi:lysozyme
MKFTGYEFLNKWEGERLEAYKDVAGIWTIGIGHTKDVYPGMKITSEQSKAFLEQDIKWATKAVDTGVKVPINQNEYNALVSLTFNIGPGDPKDGKPPGFLTSTCLKRLNEGDRIGAADALTWWTKARVNGKLVVVRGLVNRRAAEKELFLTPPLIIVDWDEEAITELTKKFVKDLKEIWDRGLLNE